MFINPFIDEDEKEYYRENRGEWFHDWGRWYITWGIMIAAIIISIIGIVGILIR